MRQLPRPRLLVSSLCFFFMAVAATGCCAGVQCGACPQPGIHVRVVEQGTETPIEDATVMAGSTRCEVDSTGGAGVYVCNVVAGAHDITVTATGYQEKKTSATLEEPDDSSCCSCGSQLDVTVELVKAP